MLFNIYKIQELKKRFRNDETLVCQYRGGSSKKVLVSAEEGWILKNIAIWRKDQDGFVYLSDCTL